jgi:hypothetical protein
LVDQVEYRLRLRPDVQVDLDAEFRHHLDPAEWWAFESRHHPVPVEWWAAEFRRHPALVG